MRSSNVLVIYHADCWDGFCAAWLMHTSGQFEGAEYHAAHYGTDPPNVTGKDVYILDFSYKRPVMRSILSKARQVTVLDHHATAQQELEGLLDEFLSHPDLIARPNNAILPVVIFDTTKSGARLTWEYLCPQHTDSVIDVRQGDFEPAPWLVDYTEDRDLWRWKLPLSREINAALRSYPLDFATWDALWQSDPKRDPSLAQEGRAILRREQQIIESHVANAHETTIAGHKVLCVNATVLISEIAGELAKDRPFGACYFDRADGHRVFSLRSRFGAGIDVSDIARCFSGGGHKHAAGFEVRSSDPIA